MRSSDAAAAFVGDPFQYFEVRCRFGRLGDVAEAVPNPADTLPCPSKQIERAPGRRGARLGLQ